MKVVVSSQGPEAASEVDPRFGRAKYFLLCDTDTGQVTPLDNSRNRDASQGAGIQASQRVVSLDAEAVVTGNVGPKAFLALSAGGVEVYVGAHGTVNEALDELKKGKLQRAESPTVEGHWTPQG